MMSMRSMTPMSSGVPRPRLPRNPEALNSQYRGGQGVNKTKGAPVLALVGESQDGVAGAGVLVSKVADLE